MKTIQIKRGSKAGIPQLAEGEFGLVLDEKELYIGTPNGNTEIPMLDSAGRLPVDAIPEGVGGGVVVVPNGTEVPLPERRPGYLYFIEKYAFSLKVTPEFTLEIIETAKGGEK